jgi:signal peptidase I
MSPIAQRRRTLRGVWRRPPQNGTRPRSQPLLSRFNRTLQRDSLFCLSGIASDEAVSVLPTDAGRHGWTRRRFVEWGAIVAIAVLVALLLRIFVVQTFFIPSTSMYPTLKVGDRILVNKLAYHLHGVGRGDIIVFKAPAGVRTKCDTTDTVLVKRIIGLPGETISDKDGRVYINGKVLSEPWLPKHDSLTKTFPFAPVHIGANRYFVMGDNRIYSCDSRYWGTVPRSSIIGKAEMRIWPLSRLGFF